MDAKYSRTGAPRDANVSPSATNEKRRRVGLGKAKILRGRKLFREVFQNGNYSHGRWFDTVSLTIANGDGKAAFTTVRRVRRAVDRNRIKRRLREAYRLEQPERLPRLVVFIGNVGILTLEFAALRQEMRRTLSNLLQADKPSRRA
jgi:ribonuclease P protein component